MGVDGPPVFSGKVFRTGVPHGAELHGLRDVALADCMPSVYWRVTPGLVPGFGAQRSRILEARRKQCSFIVTDERQRRRVRSARRLVPIWVLRATRLVQRDVSFE